MSRIEFLEDYLHIHVEVGDYLKAIAAEERAQQEVIRLRVEKRFKHMQTACKVLGDKSQKVNIAEAKLLKKIREYDL